MAVIVAAAVGAPPVSRTYVMRGADGHAVARLTLRSGRHAETKFVIELVAADAGAEGSGVGGNIDAGGSHAVFVDREVDCRLAFDLGEHVVAVAQTGTCGLAPGTSVAGRYRRDAPSRR